MRRGVLACGALVVAAVCGPVGTASAQAPRPVGPVSQPGFSPYLNLLRRDNPTYLNYYGLVRPQVDFRQSIQTLQQDLNAYQSMAQQSANQANALTTGHRSSFMNTMGYFMTMGGGPGNRQGAQPGVGRVGAYGVPGQSSAGVGTPAPRAPTPPRR